MAVLVVVLPYIYNIENGINCQSMSICHSVSKTQNLWHLFIILTFINGLNITHGDTHII